MLAVMTSPESKQAVSRMYSAASKAELDAKSLPYKAAFEYITTEFNGDGRYQLPNQGAVNDLKLDINSESLKPMLPGQVQENFQKLRTAFSRDYSNWTKSCNNDPDNFPSFGRPIVL